MIDRYNNSSDEALDEIESLISRIVIHEDKLSEFRKIIKDARSRKTVPILGIQYKLLEYRRKYNIVEEFSEDEKEMMRDYMDLWG